MAHPYVLWQGGSVYLQAQFQEHGGDTGRQAIIRGELDRAIEGQQPNRSTSICTGGALQKVLGLQQAPDVHVSDQTVNP